MNQSQEQAIKKINGPCLILAGAGTGKTYTIVEKIKYIIKNKIYPAEKIICLTFSNEAANSLREKILPHIRDSSPEPIIKTFHSFCSDLLKKHGEKINQEKFSILLPDDAKILLHKNFKVPPYYCNLYISEIGIAKDLGITTEQLENHLKSKTNLTNGELEQELENAKFLSHTSTENKYYLKENAEKLERLFNLSKLLQTWKAYEKLKQKKSLLDYSDLNILALKLLKQNPQISNEFSYIIVDEFQDTNKLQCDLLESLCFNNNITVVGDMNQSIYRFRGAYKNNLEKFREVFSVRQSDTFTLDKSHRSTNKILEIAHQLIKNNYKKQEDCFKVVSAKNTEGNTTKIYELENNKEEIRKILEIIKEEIKNNTPLKDICVMFRTHQQARMLKNSLEYESIPYTSITKKSLFKINIIKIIRAYLVILNCILQKTKGAERALWDLIHCSQFPIEDEISLSNFIKENREDPLLSIKFMNQQNIKLTEKGSLQLRLLIKNLSSLISEKNSPITNTIKKLYETLNIASTVREKEKILVLEKFYTLAKEHEEIESESLSDFLHHLNIIDSLGIEIEAPSLDNSGIRIMTSHATKGLEYECVILSNLAQKKFPIEKINSSLIPQELSPEILNIIKNMKEEEKEFIVKKHEQENQLLEERRLCYVSLTRAKSRLYITYAKKYSSRFYYPSQFLQEINYKNNPNISFNADKQLIYKEPSQQMLNSVIPEAENINKIIPSSKRLTFSPSSLQAFDECQKKYEYKYIYNMPEPASIPWEAIKLGSFIHKVLEESVKADYKEEKQFTDLAKIMQMEDEWNFINLQEAMPLIKVFYYRNKDKYGPDSLTEQYLKANISGLEFNGYADRIDIKQNNELEIIDYKTGKGFIPAKYRNWQLGFYALASKHLGTPKKLTLEMLNKEKPIEFILDEKGNANEIHSKMTHFNLHEVKEQMIETANKILECQKNNLFKPCPVEKSCQFCEEWIY